MAPCACSRSKARRMTDVMQYERAYQASSRVITVIDSLLDTVINGMGKI